MTFTIEVTDPSHLAGITAAREAYNATLPEHRGEDGVVVDPNPNLLATDQDYIQFVLGRAAESYAKQYGA